MEDDEQVLFVWRSALQKLTNRVHVETARNGTEALYQIGKAPFDLVITDLRMPGLSGQELTRAIRRLRPDLPVIWITAYRSAEIDAEAKRLQVICCLDKPLTVAQIRQMVALVICCLDKPLTVAQIGLMVAQVLEGPDRRVQIAPTGR